MVLLSGGTAAAAGGAVGATMEPAPWPCQFCGHPWPTLERGEHSGPRCAGSLGRMHHGAGHRISYAAERLERAWPARPVKWEQGMSATSVVPTASTASSGARTLWELIANA